MGNKKINIKKLKLEWVKSLKKQIFENNIDEETMLLDLNFSKEKYDDVMFTNDDNVGEVFLVSQYVKKNKNNKRYN